jgi:Uma2 family endonuclease
VATAPIKLISYEEWLRMPPVQDGTDEVVKGEYRFMPSTRYPHAEIIQRLVIRFARQLDENEVNILGSNFGLLITRDPLTCRSPDLALYWKDRDLIEDGLHVAAPDLIVEVLSPSEDRRGKEEKLEDYARIRVPEVWLVSPQSRSLEVCVLGSRNLVDGTLSPTRFPSVSIQVESIQVLR